VQIAQFLIGVSGRFPVLDSYLHRLRTGMDMSWQAVIEIVLIGAVIYAVLSFLEGTRGARLMQAVLAILTGLLFLAFVARLLQLDRILVLYPYFVGGAFLIALVVFQPELRRGLMRIGEKLGRGSRTMQSSKLIEPIVGMAANFSKRKIGALVAIARRVPFGGLIESGVRIDAEISRELLETIFWPGSALHDLGVLISHGRVAAAGVQFPLAEPEGGDRLIGSRHRAALGLSVETDAMVVVVSEETGTISVALRGALHRCESPEHLREMLIAGLLGMGEPAEVAKAPPTAVVALPSSSRSEEKASEPPAELLHEAAPAPDEALAETEASS
jgi:diadenylate cyclase